MPSRMPSRRPANPFKISQPKMPKIKGLGSLGRSDPRVYQGPPEDGDPEVVALLERAIDECLPVSAAYGDDTDDDPRLFCPAAIGRLRGDRKVLIYQISGETEAGLERSRERCLRVAELRHVELREGPWVPIETDIREAHCLKNGKIEKFSQCPGDPERPAQRWR